MTKSNEGLEGTVVNIYGGDISIVSSDDAVNAANSDGLYEGVLDYAFNMLGGKLVRSNKKQKTWSRIGGLPRCGSMLFL